MAVEILGEIFLETTSNPIVAMRHNCHFVLCYINPE